MDIEFIKEVVYATRKALKFHSELTGVIAKPAHVNLTEKGDGSFELASIEFSWYDSIYVTKKGILFHPGHGLDKWIVEYDGFEAFIEMTK